ncbi:hypothetical protein HELRODRAFT_167881 [Helobdella robusta]|uniref:ADAM cysteine-rich domain-containing protein n=1 Tax=Helobdella robusta TaxID=6412 RepID=T1EZX0_HELRO|nr:hypothetical protein HELRODRAFT_167881 [Helobdella robusta]ESO10039.1 hypothetical protein HELRODRAFT_167881 [Helobdella robusta]
MLIQQMILPIDNGYYIGDVRGHPRSNAAITTCGQQIKVKVFASDRVGSDVVMAYCSEGKCRTHDTQCALVWGSGIKSSPESSYTEGNMRGTKLQHNFTGYITFLGTTLTCNYASLNFGTQIPNPAYVQNGLSNLYQNKFYVCNNKGTVNVQMVQRIHDVLVT